MGKETAEALFLGLKLETLMRPVQTKEPTPMASLDLEIASLGITPQSLYHEMEDRMNCFLLLELNQVPKVVACAGWISHSGRQQERGDKFTKR